jgi:inosine/xanthosine triphosphatase
MKIHLGSQNQVKLKALKEIILNYDFLSKAEVFGLAVDSGVSEQPKSIEETISGAKNRCRKVFLNSDLSFGLEDGLMKVPYTKTGYMNVCVCAIYNGERFYIGLSSAYEYPAEVIDLVFNKSLDINQAFYKLALTKNPKIGSAQGAIGVLSDSFLNRKEYTKQAIISALIYVKYRN